MFIYLVRHGQTRTNVHFVPGSMRPKTEPLTKTGSEQAVAAANYIEAQNNAPSIIVSSPYTRALSTAKVISQRLNIAMGEDGRLGEYSPGDWDSLGFDEFTDKFNEIPIKDRYDFRPPNGESWLDEAKRFSAVIQLAKNNNHQCAVFVSHYDPIKAVINLLTQKPTDIWDDGVEYPPGSVTMLSEDSEGVWELVED